MERWICILASQGIAIAAMTLSFLAASAVTGAEISASVQGAAVKGDPHAESHVRPDQLVGRQGARPLFNAWFSGGRRAAARIALTANQFDHVAFPFVTAAQIKVELVGEKDLTYTIHPDYVSKEHVLGEGLTATSYWFASVDRPMAAVLVRFRNSTSSPVSQTIRESAVLPASLDRAEPAVSRSAGASLVRWQTQRADVTDAFLCSSLPGDPEISGGDAGKGNASLTCSKEATLQVPAGDSREYWLVLSAGREGEKLSAPSNRVVQSELKRMQKFSERIFNAGPIVRTPDDSVNTYFAWTKCIPWKCSYELPIGEPYLLSSRDNKWVPVLNPVVGQGLGVWANDCVQTLWECSTLGPDYYPIIESTLDAYYGHSIPESVEFHKADGTPWYVFLRCGQQPEWVMGAASYLLISGRKTAFDRFWPGIRQVLQSFYALCDSDRDWLDDYTTSPFPEQPFTGPYNHEMLYASSYWYAAFDAASEAAELFGRSSEAKDLRWQAGKIRSAINEKFATDYGYASWLKVEQDWKPADEPWEALQTLPHEQHPQVGHNQTFPCELGIATQELADTALNTLTSPPLMSGAGPLVGYVPPKEEGQQPEIWGGAWNYARWDLIRGLYRYGHTDQATALLKKWVDQESTSLLRYQSAELWGSPTSITNLGFVWGAGRAIRAILFGLFGAEATGSGVRIRPRLPADWPQMSLENYIVRGSSFNITTRRGPSLGITVDGVAIEGDTVPQTYCDGRKHEVVVVVR